MIYESSSSIDPTEMLKVILFQGIAALSKLESFFWQNAGTFQGSTEAFIMTSDSSMDIFPEDSYEVYR